MSEHGHRHDRGGVGEEAARLLEAVQEWARRTAGAGSEGMAGARGAGAVDAAAGPTDPPWTERIATDALECQLCPLCRLIAVVRGTRPEVVEHLADATASLAAAIRDLVAAGERDRTARDGVERIDIG